ncbi:hypothetical protein [Saccharopolyspora phatthalungensis]|uniref:Septal ring-binding cell division protein DamX n=1 Tax=Saccharopolyspora phatthalungensis TaxID=664693 RepID=A0A840QG18_9PSEU|nr:hypothetical protein [Saccharopolyspora phatthalungensis]MBB5159037.1 septal ring-binding cell division protein DamX [Saccharopolyspora phatthalungensis]
MNPAASQVGVLWAVSVGVGFVVLLVVIVLVHLLLKSVRALDKRVDHVWSAAVGLFVHTLTAAPQLSSAARNVASFERDAQATTDPTVRTATGRGK